MIQQVNAVFRRITYEAKFIDNTWEFTVKNKWLNKLCLKLSSWGWIKNSQFKKWTTSEERVVIEPQNILQDADLNMIHYYKELNERVIFFVGHEHWAVIKHQFNFNYHVVHPDNTVSRFNLSFGTIVLCPSIKGVLILPESYFKELKKDL